MFDMVPHCQVPRCPPLLYGAVLSGSAMSTPAIWCRVVQSRDVSPHNFDGLAMSSSAFSVAPFHPQWTLQVDNETKLHWFHNHRLAKGRVPA